MTVNSWSCWTSLPVRVIGAACEVGFGDAHILTAGVTAFQGWEN
jgi:hypothetical protein